DLGGAEQVEVIEILVAAGDQVEAEESIIVLETDKATMEIPSPLNG
ncbi:MAG TPA: dihydrolipoyl dehydrogenase, partial [Oceanospirillales bacterium]|nr:dihydrolipoyl dehydrogenase [Oceanospirillales bacterium]